MYALDISKIPLMTAPLLVCSMLEGVLDIRPNIQVCTIGHIFILASLTCHQSDRNSIVLPQFSPFSSCIIYKSNISIIENDDYQNKMSLVVSTEVHTTPAQGVLSRDPPGKKTKFCDFSKEINGLSEQAKYKTKLDISETGSTSLPWKSTLIQYPVSSGQP